MCILINYDIHMLNKNAYQHTYYAQHIFDIVTVSISNMYVCADSRIKSNKKTLHCMSAYLIWFS